MSYDQSPFACKYGNGAGSCFGPAMRNGARASRVTTHGEIDVPKLFARNGPSGTYSHFCTSRALQSLKIV